MTHKRLMTNDNKPTTTKTNPIQTQKCGRSVPASQRFYQTKPKTCHTDLPLPKGDTQRRWIQNKANFYSGLSSGVSGLKKQNKPKIRNEPKLNISLIFMKVGNYETKPFECDCPGGMDWMFDILTHKWYHNFV